MKDNGTAVRETGYMRMLEGDCAGAIRDFSRAIRLNPGDVSARMLLATIYEKNGSPAQALKAYAAAGRLLEKKGDREGAAGVRRKIDLLKR